MLKTGFDMDPFVVTSFGKKVFRTRVVRHSYVCVLPVGFPHSSHMTERIVWVSTGV